jgi:hypothetical protein
MSTGSRKRLKLLERLEQLKLANHGIHKPRANRT